MVLAVRLAALGVLCANAPYPAPTVYPSPDEVTKASFPGFSSDPVPPLGEGESTKTKSATLVDSFVDRIEATYGTRFKPPAGLIDWLAKHETIRTDFWLALHPVYDDIGKAMELMNELRRRDEKRLVAFAHLAIALAVVWDNPDAVTTARYFTVGDVKARQYGPTLGPLEIFDYFSDPARQRRFAFRPSALPWPLLVHLVNLDISMEEAEWVLEKYEGQKRNLVGPYHEVPYDDGKAANNPPLLGDRPYTLQNLKQWGGVCGDQAHFGSRVGKALGVPAMKVDGTGRYGGAGHAWMGFLSIQKKRPVLLFTGRYFLDFYYTGGVYDPQTRTFIKDRTVAMLYDGISLSYKKFLTSQVLLRIAEGLFSTDPEASLTFTIEALRSNYYTQDAWALLGRHLEKKHLDLDEGISWYNKMLAALAEHPDVTYDYLRSLIRCCDPDDFAKRQTLYGKAYPLYKDRPDLQIPLRNLQGNNLYRMAEATSRKKALVLWLSCAADNAPQGSLVLPLVEKGITAAKKLEMESVAMKYLDIVARNMPHRRDRELSDAYKEFAKIVTPFYQSLGSKGAVTLRLIEQKLTGP